MTLIVRGKLLDFRDYIDETDGEPTNPSPAPEDLPPRPLDVANLEYLCVQIVNGYSGWSGTATFWIEGSNQSDIIGFGSLKSALKLTPLKVEGAATVDSSGTVTLTEGISLVYYRHIPHYVVTKTDFEGGDPRVGNFNVHLYGWMV